MDIRDKLDPVLLAIFDIEIAGGNQVARVDEPAGTLSPLAVVFKNRLNRSRIEESIKVPDHIVWHENDDQHYEINGMGGYASKSTHQFVYGPLKHR